MVFVFLDYLLFLTINGIPYMVISNKWSLFVITIYCYFESNMYVFIFMQEFMFTTGFPLRFHIKKQTNLSLFMVPKDGGDLKDRVSAALMFIIDHQERFPMDFMVKFRAYCFHVLAKNSFGVSRGMSYSCSMCCTNFAPQNFMTTINTKIKGELIKFDRIVSKDGANANPNDNLELHKIKAEFFPQLIVIEKLGSEFPLNTRLTKGGINCKDLSTKCKMLTKTYTYPPNDFLNVKKLYESNGWKVTKDAEE